MLRVAAGGFYEPAGWHADWLAANVCAFGFGACYIPETLSEFNVSKESYSGVGQRSNFQYRVLLFLINRLVQLVDTRTLSLIKKSGALGAFGLNVVPLLWQHHRQFINTALLNNAVRRTAQTTGKRILPSWLASVALSRYNKQKPVLT